MAPERREAGQEGGRFRQRERGTSHAKAFRQWLVQTVGLCRLCHGSGVLDIAGGKGQLSFELLNLQSVPTTVVDPRPLNVAKYCQSFRMGHYGRRPAGATPRAPLHIQRFWEPRLWSPQAPACEVQRQLKDAWERAHGKELQRLNRAGGTCGGEQAPDERGTVGCYATMSGGAKSVEERASGRKKEKVKPKFRGVYYDQTAWSGRGGFVACIRAGGKRHDLGIFSSEEEAAAAYDSAALQLLGPDTHLNLPRESLQSQAPAADERGGRARRARPRGCWRCGPMTFSVAELTHTHAGESREPAFNEGGCRVVEVATDGFSGWSQHKAFQCPHNKQGSKAGDDGGETASREGEAAMVVDSEEEIQSIIANCSILVGLHPDQATGDLVDFALAHDKPFAVVPCCTFHEHFRDRFLPSGKRMPVWLLFARTWGPKQPWQAGRPSRGGGSLLGTIPEFRVSHHKTVVLRRASVAAGSLLFALATSSHRSAALSISDNKSRSTMSRAGGAGALNRREPPCSSMRLLLALTRDALAGKPVKSYGDLVQWIMAKDTRIKRDELPTGGRNIVLHFLCEPSGHAPSVAAPASPPGAREVWRGQGA